MDSENRYGLHISRSFTAEQAAKIMENCLEENDCTEAETAEFHGDSFASESESYDWRPILPPLVYQTHVRVCVCVCVRVLMVTPQSLILVLSLPLPPTLLSLNNISDGSRPG